MVATAALSGCYSPSCDAALRLSTLTLDFSAFPAAGAGLEFAIECPGKDACSVEPAGRRYDASAKVSVGVLPEMKTIHVFVYDKQLKRLVAETTVDPVPWDPPLKPNTCPMPAKATVKL